MPEGDTIHRAAARLRPALEGQPLVRLELRSFSGPTPEPGERVVAVRAVGKHLLVEFSGGLTLRTHLGMTGRWRLHRRGDPRLGSLFGASAVLEVAGFVAVCSRAPVAELTRSERVAITHLGPDLCEPQPDFDGVLERLERLGAPTAAIAELLLDQRIASGIGNVYKSETLYRERVDPRAPLASLTRERRLALFVRAHRLLRANLGTARRRTTLTGLSVYGRRGLPCPACRHPIERILQGARSTYFCPECQHG